MPGNPISQFVILRHHVGSNPTRESEVAGSVHYDWMFLIGDKLCTWSTVVVGSLTKDTCIDAVRLPDHRAAYLDFQGDIGGDRGTVAQVARGTFALIEDSDDRFQCHISWVDSADKTGDQQGRDQHSNDQSIEFYRNRSIDLLDEWRLRLGRKETKR